MSTIKFTINLEKDFHKKLKSYCAMNGLSMKEYIVSLILIDINKNKKQNEK